MSTTLKNSLKTGLFNCNEPVQYLNSPICAVLYNLLAKIQDFSRTTFGFCFQLSSFWMKSFLVLFLTKQFLDENQVVDVKFPGIIYN